MYKAWNVEHSNTTAQNVFIIKPETKKVDDGDDDDDDNDYYNARAAAEGVVEIVFVDY